ncbi:hypothetical protein LTR36_004539 [Oleoguttula mirabilis]|uniref:Uncharacterized protein n=1 Tax=Oleoguttula mirabilis TaxID=1507867 RepID=A0AAV9JHR9_9PEZI|nr:hypothetical protein LTR36_004539 [Oleoguttula mirabilis]
MALHHRPEIDDMRYAYDSNRSRRSASSGSESSYESSSEKSYQTQPTDYSSSPSKRPPPHVQYNPCESKVSDAPRQYFDDRAPQESPRSSADTYASTTPSEEEEPLEEIPEYDVPEYTARPYESRVIPATPADFSELFPSRRRLAIRHDDSTLDGNMNLRVDTEVPIQGLKSDMTLFHLRMHDLKEREFSLRRYCRDSGREVCHTTRKQQKATAQKRPGFQRSLSNALNSMRPKSESRAPTLANLQRNDSGYASTHSVDFDEDKRPRSSGHGATPQQQLSTDTLKLEFSNYAQVDVKRTGAKGSKRYEFEYWGKTYAWRRIVRKDGAVKEIDYHLTKAGSDQVLAYIVPVSLTPAQVQEEQNKGGWIPPCAMWLADESLVRGLKDAVDVVIASGLMALVDDAVRARFDCKTSKQLLVPMSKMGVEYVGPARLINELFRRDSGTSQPTRPPTSGRPSTGGYGVTGSRTPSGVVRQSSYER